MITTIEDQNFVAFGNRPRRVQIGLLRAASPAWRNGDSESNTGDWRGLFATRLTADRMFARNFANRLWKEMFGMGLVEPVDQLDPARLDPKNPPTLDEWKAGAEEFPGSWWHDWDKWLLALSGPMVPARVPAQGGLPALEDAPGSYVKVRSVD